MQIDVIKINIWKNVSFNIKEEDETENMFGITITEAPNVSNYALKRKTAFLIVYHRTMKQLKRH